MMTTTTTSSELKFLENHNKRTKSLQKSKQKSDKNDYFEVLMKQVKIIHVDIEHIIRNSMDKNDVIVVTSAQRHAFEAKLDGIHARIRAVEYEFVSSLHHHGMIANYERKMKEDIQALFQDLEDVRSKFLPRQRFRFRNRARVVCNYDNDEKVQTTHLHSSSIGADVTNAANIVSVSDNESDVCDCDADIANAKPDTDVDASPQIIIQRSDLIMNQVIEECGGFDDDREIANISDRTIDIKDYFSCLDEIRKGRIHFRLRNLTRCVVVLREVFGAVRMQNLRECTVYCGPVAGPVYVEGCNEHCKIFVAARQLRIHETHDVDFYVHTSSGPIIESCSRVRFGNYRILHYDSLEEQMKSSNLANTVNCFADVKDFKWHKIQKSPNWTLIDEKKTIHSSLSEFIAINGGGNIDDNETNKTEKAKDDVDEDTDDEL